MPEYFLILAFILAFCTGPLVMSQKEKQSNILLKQSDLQCATLIEQSAI